MQVQGDAVEMGGYYRPNKALLTAVMRPSSSLNSIIDGLNT